MAAHTLDKLEKASNGVDQPEHHRSAGSPPERWRAFTWTLSRISDFHNDALVMQLQPLNGEKPATLDDLVGYRVCRCAATASFTTSNYTPAEDMAWAAKSSGGSSAPPPGPPMGNQSLEAIVRRILGADERRISGGPY